MPGETFPLTTTRAIAALLARMLTATACAQMDLGALCDVAGVTLPQTASNGAVDAGLSVVGKARTLPFVDPRSLDLTEAVTGRRLADLLTCSARRSPQPSSRRIAHHPMMPTWAR